MTLLELLGQKTVFHFIDFRSTNFTLSQDQGKLFERLVKDIDVLKEYLKTGSIPFGIKYVFRTSPIATLNLLDRIITHNWKTLAEIREKERKSIGGILNRLHELRLLGLLDYSHGQIILADVTINAYQSESIGQLLQDRVRQNGVVKDILDRLAVTERIRFTELRDLMKTSMPLLEVSEDKSNERAQRPQVWVYLQAF